MSFLSTTVWSRIKVELYRNVDLIELHEQWVVGDDLDGPSIFSRVDHTTSLVWSVEDGPTLLWAIDDEPTLYPYTNDGASVLGYVDDGLLLFPWVNVVANVVKVVVVVLIDTWFPTVILLK